MTERRAVAIEWTVIALAYLGLTGATLSVLSHTPGAVQPGSVNVILAGELPLVMCVGLWTTQRLSDWGGWLRTKATFGTHLWAIAVALGYAILAGLAMSPQTFVTTFGSIVETILVAPIVEEIFFRGYLLWSAARAFGAPVGVITSAVMFGAMHLPGGWIGAAWAGVAGGFFSVLSLRSRSIHPAIVSHAVFNAAQILILAAGSWLSDLGSGGPL